MRVLSQFVAPWALAREQFPLHLIWEPTDDFDRVELVIPEDLELKEILNVGSYAADDKMIMFRKDEMLTTNYFTAILSAKKPYADVIVNRPIQVRFLEDQAVKYSTTLQARIVRPAIRFIDLKPTITIREGANLKKLFNIKIRHSGLGRTEIKIDVQAHGNIISEPNTLYYQVVKEIIDDLSTGVEVQEGEDIEKQVPDVVFNPVRLQEEALDFMKRLEQGELAPGAKAEAIQKLAELLKDETFKKKLLNIMYTKLVRIYLSYIVYFFDRYPHEDVTLPLGRVKVNLSAHIQKMTIKFSYFDSYNNEYEPIEATLQIDDQRRSRALRASFEHRVGERTTENRPSRSRSTTLSAEDVSKIPDLVRFLDEVMKRLSPYKPDVKKLQIDYVEKRSEIRLGIEVPGGIKRKIRDIEIPVYGNYIITEIVDESFNVVNVVPRLENGKYLIDAAKLPSSERYMIAMAGTVSEATLQKLVRLDVPEDPVRESDSDRYWVHSAIKDLSIIEKMYSELNIDKVLATIKVGVERTFSSSVPSEIVDYLKARAIADDALSGADRGRLFKEWQHYRAAKRNIGNLPPYEVFDFMMKPMTPETFKIYVSINKPFRLHSVIPVESGARVPDKMGVNVQTELNYKCPAAEGDLVFNKRDFSDHVKKEFDKLMKKNPEDSK